MTTAAATGAHASRLTSAVRRRLAAVGRVLRTILGAPDYERYVAHCRERHPDVAPLARDEFVRSRLAARYERPGARCC